MYDTRSGAFSGLHPITLTLYFAAVTAVAVITSNPMFAAVGFIGSLLYRAVFGIKPKQAFLYLTLMLLLAVTNPLFSHHGDTPLLFVNGKAVTLEALVYGGITAVIIAEVLLWCSGLSRCLTSDKIIYMAGRIFPKLSLVISMTIRFIPYCRQEFNKICSARRCIGRFSDESITERIKSLLTAFSALSGAVLEGSADTADSMRARGLMLKGRTSFHLFRISAADIAVMTYTAVSFGFIVYVLAAGAADFRCYPYITAIPVNILSVSACFLYAVLAAIPFLFEVKEAVTWKLLQSKI